jgi:hypothetical protein
MQRWYQLTQANPQLQLHPSQILQQPSPVLLSLRQQQQQQPSLPPGLPLRTQLLLLPVLLQLTLQQPAQQLLLRERLHLVWHQLQLLPAV